MFIKNIVRFRYVPSTLWKNCALLQTTWVALVGAVHFDCRKNKCTLGPLTSAIVAVYGLTVLIGNRLKRVVLCTLVNTRYRSICCYGRSIAEALNKLITLKQNFR